MKIRGSIGILPRLCNNKNDSIVVSMTSFPARIKNVWMVIDSICRQKMRPSLIILYLASEEFPNKDNDLPHILRRYEKYGLRIVWVPDNLKPHKKYYYAFQEYPDRAVITIDDDIYYRDDMISRLWNMSLDGQYGICANRVTTILNSKFELEKYNDWGKDKKVAPGVSYNYLAIGTCGVLYPPKVLREGKVLEADSIIRNCLNADDLWLKCHEILNEIPVKTGLFYSQSIELLGSQSVSLNSSNCDDTVMSGNDIQWSNLNEVYSVSNKLINLVKKESKK